MVARCSPAPPGLSDSDGAESATVSRERRRVGLAARVAVAEFNVATEARLGRIEAALSRLEVMLTSMHATTTTIASQ